MSRIGTTISAADANRRFSELLQSVKRGKSVIVTSHGKAVAKIAPIDDNHDVRNTARTALLARLRSERPTSIGRWTRDELYD
jgi:prevent-host-death family protein